MPSPIVHFEIGCRDNPAAQKFYGELFGWTFEAYGPAAMIRNLGKFAGTEGIGGHINTLGHPPHNYTVIYAQVDDLPSAIRKAESLGGKQLVPPQEIPGMGSFAWITDPEGTAVGLWKPV